MMCAVVTVVQTCALPISGRTRLQYRLSGSSLFFACAGLVRLRSKGRRRRSLSAGRKLDQVIVEILRGADRLPPREPGQGHVVDRREAHLGRFREAAGVLVGARPIGMPEPAVDRKSTRL